MFDTRKFAIQIQATTRTIFKCDENGIGGLANIEQIENDPFSTILFVVGNYYNKIDQCSKKKVDLFVGAYVDQLHKSIQDLGEENIKSIISEFNEIIKTV